MKRFAAIILTILFLSLCGCKKNPADYLSDISSFFKDNIGDTYDIIIEKAENIGKDIVSIAEKSNIDRKDVITIKPKAVEVDGINLSAYTKLSDLQKKLYSIMLTAVTDMELKKIDITDYVSGSGFGDAVAAHLALLCDNPDIFWAPKTFSLLSVEGKNNKYLCFKDYFSDDDGTGFYGITKEQKSQMQAELQSEIQQILTVAASYTTDFEKELYFHDYLCEHIVYDSDAAADLENADTNSLTAYGALVNGKAICEGYSRAMQILCKRAGIPCGVVSGEHNGVPHMWNIVEPDGELYYLDVTFDDSLYSVALHIYFNVTKEQISKDRIFDDGFSADIEYTNSDSFNFFNYNCDNTALNYFEKTGAYITEDLGLAIKAISQAASEGKNSLELKNMTSFSSKRVFDFLRRRMRETVDLKYCYRYDDENILIAVW